MIKPNSTPKFSEPSTAQFTCYSLCTQQNGKQSSWSHNLDQTRFQTTWRNAPFLHCCNAQVWMHKAIRGGTSQQNPQATLSRRGNKVKMKQRPVVTYTSRTQPRSTEPRTHGRETLTDRGIWKVFQLHQSEEGPYRTKSHSRSFLSWLPCTMPSGQGPAESIAPSWNTRPHLQRSLAPARTKSHCSISTVTSILLQVWILVLLDTGVKTTVFSKRDSFWSFV